MTLKPGGPAAGAAGWSSVSTAGFSSAAAPRQPGVSGRPIFVFPRRRVDQRGEAGYRLLRRGAGPEQRPLKPGGERRIDALRGVGGGLHEPVGETQTVLRPRPGEEPLQV